MEDDKIINSNNIPDTTEEFTVPEGIIPEENMEEKPETEEIKMPEETREENLLKEENNSETPEETTSPEKESKETPIAKAETEPEEAKTPETTEAKPKRRRGRPKKEDISMDVKIPDRLGTITQATQSEKRALYNGQKVYSIDEDKPAETEEDKLHETFLKLGNSQRTGKILEGYLSGAELIAGKVMCGVIFYGDYRVYIPQPWLFMMDTSEDKSLDDLINDQRYFTTLRIGSKVRFVVVSVDEARRFAYASRILAMDRDIQENYIDRDQRGKTNIFKGQTVQAKITYVSKTGIGVDIMGAEAFIPSDELSYMYINDCRSEGFETGATINVRIKDITPVEYRITNPFTGAKSKTVHHLVTVTASHKDTMEDPNSKYYNYFQVGGRYFGEITGRSVDGYFVRLAGMRDALVVDDRDERIPNGTKVNVKITKKNADEFRIYGRLTSIIRTYD